MRHGFGALVAPVERNVVSKEVVGNNCLETQRVVGPAKVFCGSTPSQL